MSGKGSAPRAMSRAVDLLDECLWRRGLEAIPDGVMRLLESDGHKRDEVTRLYASVRQWAFQQRILPRVR